MRHIIDKLNTTGLILAGTMAATNVAAEVAVETTCVIDNGFITINLGEDEGAFSNKEILIALDRTEEGRLVSLEGEEITTTPDQSPMASIREAGNLTPSNTVDQRASFSAQLHDQTRNSQNITDEFFITTQDWDIMGIGIATRNGINAVQISTERDNYYGSKTTECIGSGELKI